ncbi:MAG: hypothetical protein K5839_06960 [Treponemataceae bacterium]|nr:hypothetical protein [Treponemataceae bacterium]
MAFFDKMKDFLDKGVEASKSAFDKAGEQIQDFGDKSVTRIEIKKLESKLEKIHAQIGKLVTEGLAADKNFSLPVGDEDFKKLLADANATCEEIKAKNDSLQSGKAEKAETEEKEHKEKKSTKK